MFAHLVDAATIPAPANVHYEKSTRRASSTVDDTPLHLTAKIELENGDGTWRCGTKSQSSCKEYNKVWT